jgi:predicted nucleic acid-binding protein
MAKRTRRKKKAFVLDCSVAIAWCFHDEANAYADGIAAGFPGIKAIVPALWRLEVANTLLMGERRKRSTEADTVRWLAYLRSLAIMVDDETSSQAWHDALALARTHDLSVYDATYLELALRRDLPLASLDNKLKTAASVVGVTEYRP